MAGWVGKFLLSTAACSLEALPEKQRSEMAVTREQARNFEAMACRVGGENFEFVDCMM